MYNRVTLLLSLLVLLLLSLLLLLVIIVITGIIVTIIYIDMCWHCATPQTRAFCSIDCSNSQPVREAHPANEALPAAGFQAKTWPSELLKFWMLKC